MPRSTEQWAKDLIAADQIRREDYLEASHLDPWPFVFVYVRVAAFRYAWRRLRAAFRLRLSQRYKPRRAYRLESR